MFRIVRLERTSSSDLYHLAFGSEEAATASDEQLRREMPEVAGSFAPDEDEPLAVGEAWVLFTPELARLRVVLTRPLPEELLEILTDQLLTDVLPRGVGDDIPCEAIVVMGAPISEFLVVGEDDEDDEEEDEEGGNGR